MSKGLYSRHSLEMCNINWLVLELRYHSVKGLQRHIPRFFHYASILWYESGTHSLFSSLLFCKHYQHYHTCRVILTFKRRSIEYKQNSLYWTFWVNIRRVCSICGTMKYACVMPCDALRCVLFHIFVCNGYVIGSLRIRTLWEVSLFMFIEPLLVPDSNREI